MVKSKKKGKNMVTATDIRIAPAKTQGKCKGKGGKKKGKGK